jgi:ferric-dicitrate binding protein FerR (iron transport regulator)
MVRSLLAIGLSVLFIASPAMGEPSGDQSAGEVTRLVPQATRNAQPLAVKDPLQWNDVLQTNAKGRVLAKLNDGSMLNVGSSSRLTVVQHDAANQQTSIDLTYGKLRSKVTKITQPGGKYEVKTPNAVIGVIGTEFYVAYDMARNETTVICYEGEISVVPGQGFKVVKSNNATTGATNAVTVTAGQMVVIGIKLGTSETNSFSEWAMQSRKMTEVSQFHRARLFTLLTMGAIAGLTVGLTQINSSSKPCGCK